MEGGWAFISSIFKTAVYKFLAALYSLQQPQHIKFKGMKQRPESVILCACFLVANTAHDLPLRVQIQLKSSSLREEGQSDSQTCGWSEITLAVAWTLLQHYHFLKTFTQAWNLPPVCGSRPKSPGSQLQCWQSHRSTILVRCSIITFKDEIDIYYVDTWLIRLWPNLDINDVTNCTMQVFLSEHCTEKYTHFCLRSCCQLPQSTTRRKCGSTMERCNLGTSESSGSLS